MPNRLRNDASAACGAPEVRSDRSTALGTMATRSPAQWLSWILALTAAMVVTTIVLLGAHRLQRLLGERGMLAVERLMGLVLTALAVQMLLDGVRTFAHELAHLG